MPRKQPDNSVGVSVGALNNLYKLLKVDKALVRRKVKELVVMGGHLPPKPMKEAAFNFRQGRARSHVPPATVMVVQQWPTPITFSGHSIGTSIQTGACLEQTLKDNPGA